MAAKKKASGQRSKKAKTEYRYTVRNATGRTKHIKIYLGKSGNADCTTNTSKLQELFSGDVAGNSVPVTGSKKLSESKHKYVRLEGAANACCKGGTKVVRFVDAQLTADGGAGFETEDADGNPAVHKNCPPPKKPALRFK